MANPTITLRKKDYEQISQIVARLDTDTAAALEEEINRAEIMDEVSQDIVTMNSVVTFFDSEANKETSITLVYPQDADLDSNKISVLAPVGSALIGLRVGQEIDWPMPNKKSKRFKVIRVKQEL